MKQLAIFDDAPEVGAQAEVRDYRAERNLARAAEYLVACDISRRGFDCFLAGEALRYDLIADIGGLRRVQVKSKREASLRGPTSKALTYTFGNDRKSLTDYAGEVDLLALVALDRMSIVYMPMSKVDSYYLYLPASQFSGSSADMSWRDATRDWVSP